MNLFSRDNLLVLGGVLLLVCSLVFVLTTVGTKQTVVVNEALQPDPYIDPWTLTPDPEVVTLLGTEDDFTLGQYYFNHDEDPAGPYDRRLARAYYERALAADTSVSNHLVRYQLGRINFIEGQFDEAIRLFELQIEHFDETLPNVHYMLGLTHAYKALDWDEPSNWEPAEFHLRRYIEINPFSPWARTDMAWIYFSQGKYESMFPDIEAGLEQNPDHPWLLNMYGLAYLNTGQPEQALVHLETAQAVVAEYEVLDWGMAYPGNDPADWEQGLIEFKAAIDANVALVHEALDTKN